MTYSKNNSLSKLFILIGVIFSSSIIAQTDKMNLLFIITDQQRYDALSMAGNDVLQTPNIDKLGEEGVYFKNAYTPCAVCGPARASILTGHSIENTGVVDNGKTYDYWEEGLMTMPTFDEILTEEGYHCEYYGKWHTLTSKAAIYKNPTRYAKNGRSIFGSGGQSHIYRDYLEEHAPNRQLQAGEFWGWNKTPYIPDPLDKYFGMTNAQLESQGLKHSQPDQHGELRLAEEHSTTAFQAKQTIEALERLKDVQFSITCSFHFPHAPMLPTKPYYGMYPPDEMVPPVSINDDMSSSPYVNSNSRQKNPEYRDPDKLKYMISNYYGLIKEIDDWTGKILNKLDELGLTENTLVIFTSDHGEMLGAHGMREKNVFYEESAHIPLLIRFPGNIEAGTRVEEYVSLIDLFPTILDYLKVEERHSDGKSLRGLIEKTDTVHGQYVVTEWKTTSDNVPNYMILKDGWKMFIPYSTSSTVIDVLYNLNEDPYEMKNLLLNNRNAANYYDKVEELRGCLLEWLEKTGSSHYNSVRDREIVEAPYSPKGEVLIGRGSEWKYNDSGMEPDSLWVESAYDDSGWKSGSALLGFGFGDENTVLDSGYITYYFRKEFHIDTLSNYTSPLFLDILCDDGAVVYLNGEELSRRNMPSGIIDSKTLAKTDITGTAEYNYFSRLYPIDKLVEGKNLLAVEVHQSSSDSPDLSLDLGLEITPDLSTSFDGEMNLHDKKYQLFEAYPNPFNPSTSIRYEFGMSGEVKLRVYDLMGREVAELVNEYQQAGRYQVEFSPKNLSSGVYLYSLQIGSFSDTKKTDITQIVSNDNQMKRC